MHLRPDVSMGYQGSRLDGSDLTTGAAKMPVQVSYQTILTESRSTEPEQLRGLKRPLEPPQRRGVERREIVLEQAKRAATCVDLTEDFDGQPPFKSRRVTMQKNDTSDPSMKKTPSAQITPDPKTESPEAQNLVGYDVSRSASPRKNETNTIQRDSSSAKIEKDDFYNFEAEESEFDRMSESHPKIINLPFVDEGYGSFTSQEVGSTVFAVSEAELAEQLINSDGLRGSEDRLNATSYELSRLKTSDLKTRNAIALKEKIETEGAEKSKALRDAARKQNDKRVAKQKLEQALVVHPKQPKYTPQEVDILGMFGRAEDANSHPLRETYASPRINSGSTSTISGVEHDNEDDSLFGRDDNEDDFFCGSPAFTHTIEKFPSRTEEHFERDIVEIQLASPMLTPASSRDNDRNSRTDQEEPTPQSSPRQASQRAAIENEDLEAGAQKVEAYIMINERQKAGPRTTFTRRHELDVLDHSYHHTPSLPQKFYSPHGVSKRRSANVLRRPEGASGEATAFTREGSSTEVLSRAPSRPGGLAMFARRAEVDNDDPTPAPTHSLPYTSPDRSQNDKVERRYRSTIQSVSEFSVDFSKYKRAIGPEERETITRHEWLKQRQRDLKALQSTYVEAARVSCITGVTNMMDKELPEVDDFKEIVLQQRKTDPPRRIRILDIKANMIRRQTHDVLDERVEEHLGMLIDRRDRLMIANELKIVEEEMDVVANERRDKSRRQKKIKTFQFMLPGADVKPARPRIRDGTVLDLRGEPKVARPKVGTEEYRRSQSDAYENSQKQREDALREKLKQLDRSNAQPTSNGAAAVGTTADDAIRPTEEDAQSEVSEEEAGWETYANMGISSTAPISIPTPAEKEILPEEMERLDEERKQQELLALPRPVPKAADSAPASGQAPDIALAAKMRMAYLGIPEQDEDIDIEILSDTESISASDSEDSDGEPQLVINYVVYGRYTGVAELEDCTTYRLGQFLKKDNAERLIGEKVVEFCNARKRDITDATAAGDEARLAELGDPEAGLLKHDMKTQEQIVEFPASSCRIGMELKRVVARSREEKEAIVATSIFAVLYERNLPDGSTDTPAWDELVTCSGPNGVWLANREACKILLEWYGKHLEDGYLAMQKAGLEDMAEASGGEGLFDGEDSFEVPGVGKDKMRVWVEEKRNRV